MFDSEDIQRLFQLEDWANGLTGEYCEKYDLRILALVEGAISKELQGHAALSGLLEPLRKLRFNTTIYETHDEIYTAYDELRLGGCSAEEADYRLAWEFRSSLRNVILAAQTLCVAGSAALPPSISPKSGVDFLTDPKLRKKLDERWAESYRCRQVGLTLSGAVMLVSFIEGILGATFLDTLTAVQVAQLGKDKDRSGNTIELPVEKWSLDKLLAAAEKLFDGKIVNIAALRQAQLIRNHVHPLKESIELDDARAYPMDSMWLTTHQLVLAARTYVLQAGISNKPTDPAASDYGN